MADADLHFVSKLDQVKATKDIAVTSLYIAHKHHLKLVPVQFDSTSTHSYYSELNHQVAIGVLSSERSRNNAHIRDDVIQDLVSKFSSDSTAQYQITIILENRNQATAAAFAVGRCFPLYSRKTKTSNSTTPTTKTVQVKFTIIDADGKESTLSDEEYDNIRILATGVRMAGRLVDMPTAELNTKTYVEQVVQEFNKIKEAVAGRNTKEAVAIKIIQGTELKDQGFGGLWGVGKAAENLPALVVLSYTNPSAKKNMSWIGKGIVYDTGGLSIKSTDNMCSMKGDMGGSAAVFTAFRSYCLTKGDKFYNLNAVLCLAENAVSSLSYRPDDILQMYSGKTVEINNTDAEGRVVMADGVAYATKHLNPDILIDIATLTGAVLVSTGKKFAGVLSNDENLESSIVKLGRNVGDLFFPIVYAPEVLLSSSKQFHSEVADMKNSVKDRMNAQSSCAGHFVEEHLVGDKWNWKKFVDTSSSVPAEKGLWAHLDIAGTAWDGKRGTGAGSAILFEIADKFRI